MELFKVFILVNGEEKEIFLCPDRKREISSVKKDILDAVSKSKSLDEFQVYIEKRGYAVLPCREIEFEDGLFIGK